MGSEGRRRGQATVSLSRCGAATVERKEVGDRVKEQAGPRGGCATASSWMRWCDGSLARIPGGVTAHRSGSPPPPPSSTSPAAQLHSSSSSIRRPTADPSFLEWTRSIEMPSSPSTAAPTPRTSMFEVAGMGNHGQILGRNQVQRFTAMALLCSWMPLVEIAPVFCCRLRQALGPYLLRIKFSSLLLPLPINCLMKCVCASAYACSMVVGALLSLCLWSAMQHHRLCFSSPPTSQY